MVDINENSAARKMAENLVWRLEVLQHRCRYNFKTGEYRQLPTRVRRFSNAKPLDITAAVIEELVRMAPYSGIVFGDEGDPSRKYRPTTTYIKKDDTLKTGTKDATYTIVQDLLLDGEPDIYSGTDGSSCSQVSECTYYWDEVSVIDCPQGEQGTVYQIADVTRDKETDLFSYKLKRIRAITQHMEEHVSECTDDDFKTTETWDNVYGEPGNYRYDDVLHNGEKLELPAPCDFPTGTLIQVQVQENDDCTFKITVIRTTSKLEPNAMFLRYFDQFQKRFVDLQKNVHTALSKVGVEYSNGAKTTYESESNPDGTFNNRVTVETERPVSESVKGENVATRFREVMWTDANQPTAASGLPSGYSLGSWKSTKTPGGLFNNEYTGFVPIADVFGYECTDTAFLHTHVDNEVLDAYPSPEECVPVAAGGIVKSYSVMKDDRGIIVKRTDTKTEHEYRNFRKSVTSTLLGKTIEVHHRSQLNPLTEPADGTIGTTEFQVTDGRLFDVISKTFILSPAGLRLGLDCAKTVFEHSDSVEDTASAFGECVNDAGGGVRHSIQYTKDPATGSIRRKETTVNELPYPDANVSKRNTPKAVFLQYTSKNVQNSPAVDLKNATISSGSSEQRETNPGGSIDISYSSAVPNTGAKLSDACELDVTQHTHDSETVLAAGTEVKAGETLSVGGGSVKQESVTVDDNNIATKKARMTTEFDHEYGSRVHEDALQAHQIIEETSGASNPGDVNGTGVPFTATEAGSDKGSATVLSVPSSPMASTVDSGLIGSGSVKGRLKEAFTSDKLVTGGAFTRGTQFVADSELTKGGRYHSRKYKYVPKPQKWLDATVSGNGGQYVWNFKNLTHAQCQEILTDVCSAAISSPYGSFACHPYVRRTMNDFGLYDGSTGFEARSVTTSGGSGSGGDVDPVAATDLYNWWEKSIRIRPISQLDPNNSAYVAGTSYFLVETVWSHYITGYGVTLSSLTSWLTTHNGAFWASPRIQYDRSTQVYTYTVMDQQKTKIETVAGKALPSSASGTVLIENETKIDDKGSPTNGDNT